MEKFDGTPIIFTPDNEPYLGRKLLFHLDQIISSLLEQNRSTAPLSHTAQLTDHQRMACLIIPQAISIILSLRELIRQGYLFGGHVLLRPMVERAAILLYLHSYPDEICRWNRGWNHNEAPSLSKMFDAIQAKRQEPPIARGHELTASMNSLLHAKPDSSFWNFVKVGENNSGYAVSKILNRPELCDELCANMIPWIAVIQGMMAVYFSRESTTEDIP